MKNIIPDDFNIEEVLGQIENEKMKNAPLPFEKLQLLNDLKLLLIVRKSIVEQFVGSNKILFDDHPIDTYEYIKEFVKSEYDTVSFKKFCFASVEAIAEFDFHEKTNFIESIPEEIKGFYSYSIEKINDFFGEKLHTNYKEIIDKTISLNNQGICDLLSAVGIIPG